MKEVRCRATGEQHPDVFVRARSVKNAFTHSVSPRDLDGQPFYFDVEPSTEHEGKVEACNLRDAQDWHLTR